VNVFFVQEFTSTNGLLALLTTTILDLNIYHWSSPVIIFVRNNSRANKATGVHQSRHLELFVSLEFTSEKPILLEFTSNLCDVFPEIFRGSVDLLEFTGKLEL
jgi:hypothetical protein